MSEKQFEDFLRAAFQRLAELDRRCDPIRVHGLARTAEKCWRQATFTRSLRTSAAG
jgi:hypothetical protein